MPTHYYPISSGQHFDLPKVISIGSEADRTFVFESFYRNFYTLYIKQRSDILQIYFPILLRFRESR